MAAGASGEKGAADAGGGLPGEHRSGFVAVVGRPNAGKSTLVNRLIGQKIAIVSPKPQTTRNRLLGILSLDRAQVVFVDTPGLHAPLHKLGEAMVDAANAALADADLVLWVVDVSARPGEEDRRVADRLGRSDGAVQVVVLLNKCDRLRGEEVAERSSAYIALAPPGSESVLVSATRGDNLDPLVNLIVGLLPPGPQLFPPDQVTDQQVRFMAAELVREQVLRHLRDEVPHSTTVMVDRFEERAPAKAEAGAGRGDRPAPLTYISAVIYVERESQKMILLGMGGRMIKQIGQSARRSIVELLDARVYLDLWVKVRPKWRMNEHELRRLGFAPPRAKSHKKGGRHKRS